MKIRKKEETRPSNSDHGKYLSILEKKATGKEKKEKIWSRKIFNFRRRRTEKEKEQNIWRRKIHGDVDQQQGE